MKIVCKRTFLLVLAFTLSLANARRDRYEESDVHHHVERRLEKMKSMIESATKQIEMHENGRDRLSEEEYKKLQKKRDMMYRKIDHMENMSEMDYEHLRRTHDVKKDVRERMNRERDSYSREKYRR